MNKTSSIESIPEDKRNVWDVILSETEQNDPLWCDIEGLISEIVFQKDGSGSRLDSVYSLTGLAIDPSNSNQSFRPKDDLYEFVSKRFGKEDVSQEELTGFLLSSLKDYEHIFASYLKEQVKKDDEYREKAHAHFAAIRDDCIEKSQQKNYGSSILNFNYTTPFMLEDPGLGIVGARNVHGES